MGSTLLVTHQDVAELVLLEELIVDGKDRAARISEDDLDFLVEYEAGHRPGLVALQQIEDELSELCGGRHPDLVNPKYLNPRLRDRILAEAQLQYAEG